MLMAIIPIVGVQLRLLGSAEDTRESRIAWAGHVPIGLMDWDRYHIDRNGVHQPEWGRIGYLHWMAIDLPTLPTSDLKV
ncbi:hypothetical protein BDV11DRAFT_199915, partial [Aspergillus similis]